MRLNAIKCSRTSPLCRSLLISIEIVLETLVYLLTADKSFKNYFVQFERLRATVKVKCSRYRPGVAQRVGRGIALLFHDRGTSMVWVVSSTPRPHFTPGERLGTPRTGGWVGPRAGLDGRKISSPPGFDPRSVQPVVSRHTDWATRPTRARVPKQN